MVDGKTTNITTLFYHANRLASGLLAVLLLVLLTAEKTLFLVSDEKWIPPGEYLFLLRRTDRESARKKELSGSILLAHFKPLTKEDFREYAASAAAKLINIRSGLHQGENILNGVS